MWWWRKVRRAKNIPDQVRTELERFGETVIAMALANHTVGTYPLALNFLNNNWREAIDWLTERRDISARGRDRLETVEWALLILAIMGFVAIVPAIASEVAWLAVSFH